MKMLIRALMLLVTMTLVACGGGASGEAGTPVLGSGGAASSPTVTSTATSIDLIASSVTVPSGGDQVTITATVKGTGNVSLPGAAISFAADSGTLSSAQAATDTTGAATVVLAAGSDRSNRSITVTAKSGSVTGTIVLPVVGTLLQIQGATTVPLGGTIQSTLTAKDSKGTAIPGLTVTVASSLNNTLSAATATTDAQGTATIGYTAANAGSDTLTFTGGGASAAATITISAENFVFSSPVADTKIPVGTMQPVTVSYLSNNVPQAGKTVSFAATAGLVTSVNGSGACTSTATTTATTNSAGQATVCVESATASPAKVQATLTGVANVAAQATLPVTFVALTPAKVVLQVTPTALSPNPANSTAQQASVLATVTDAAGNPVSGITVDFNRVADPSGGNLSQASAVTGTSGQATVQYIAGSISTANNGVQLQATVEGFPSVAAGTANLTVTQSALFIALGTGNTVTILDDQTYQKDWVVYVTDSNGVPVSNVNLTIKALPIVYGKGQLHFNSGWGWSETPSSPTPVIIGGISDVVGQTSEGNYVCQNEDVNFNGILDPGEDLNADGILEPGNVISVTTSSTSGASSGTITTGSTGRATISLVYAKSYAYWVKVELVASAVVSGTESSTHSVFWAPGAAPDYNQQNIAPPGQTSPFGVNACTAPN